MIGLGTNDRRPFFFVVLCCLVLSPSLSAAYQTKGEKFPSSWFQGSGGGDASEWLTLLETARAQFAPHLTLQDISWLYTSAWNGFVEGPTWSAWWTQNSYGTTYTALPWLPEPFRTFIKNANWLWFKWEGDGKTVGRDSPLPAPDGCLCDDADLAGADYKQGDGNVPIHDWALEETLSGVIMQAEQLLIDRNIADITTYIPLFNRTLNLIESRRDPSTNLFWSGVSCNLLAPSYGAYLLENGTRAPAYLTGMSVSYVAALDRMISLEMLVGSTESAELHRTRRDSTLAGLPALLSPTGDYFVKWKDPNGTLHGVLGAPRHGYFEAVVNHDAIAFGVADRVIPELSMRIMGVMVSNRIPANPATGGPGLRPHSLVITNAGSLDDMEYPNNTWLWAYGTWVNGGEWATCEARMMLAYARTGRLPYSLDSMRSLMGFANIFRMDSPLVEWGSAVYQPSEPINTVYDMWAIPAALLRSLWDPVYEHHVLTLRPHLPGNFTSFQQNFPLRWGPYRLYLSAFGVVTAGITQVTINGMNWTDFTGDQVRLPYDDLPNGTYDLKIRLRYTSSSGSRGPHPLPSPMRYTPHPQTIATSHRCQENVAKYNRRNASLLTQPNCTLPAALVSATARLQSFALKMRLNGYVDDENYELSHGALAINSVQVWGMRCEGLNNGTIPHLPDNASDVAANAGYLGTATTLVDGVTGVLNGYCNATDAARQAIYKIWMSTM